MNLPLPVAILHLLERLGATLATGDRPSSKELADCCLQNGYPAFESVLAFESAFGGLEIPDEPGAPEGEPTWIMGAHACLRSDAHVAPRGGHKPGQLVPVVYSPNDVIYFLDERGQAFAQDTIEDAKAVAYAMDGTALICRIVLDLTFFARQETTLELPGLQADAFANRLQLSLIPEASGPDRRFFSDASGDILLHESTKAKSTVLATATQTLLARIQPPLAPVIDTSECSPYQRMAQVRIVGERRTALPACIGLLPDMTELDVSSNRLATLPESLWQARQLVSLDLSFNPLTDISGIGNLKALRSLLLRGCPFSALPESIIQLKGLTKLILTECDALDVDAALHLIARLPKLRDLSLPLSKHLTNLAPIAQLPLKSLYLSGANVSHPDRLPAGLGALPKLTDLRIEYADDVAGLPEAKADIQALRLLFHKRFTDDDIRRSASRQPEKLYLQALVEGL